MLVPSAYVAFLQALMPRKPRAEIYSAVGLHKQGKNSFYRDLLHHLRHSSDHFPIAPGVKGMVMLVFALPSFPCVFKPIKDFYPAQKHTTREQVKDKYRLVKKPDRVGRMADTLEYSKVALPLWRFETELAEELQHFCPSLLEITVEGQAGEVIIAHVYIERRMVAANIFPGDMLWKNFGITRQGKVVFYDYDEIEYLSDCRFRHLPTEAGHEPTSPDDPGFEVGPKDVFPQTFGPFLLGNPMVRQTFLEHHAELLDPDHWNAYQQRILAGTMLDVFPYEAQRRFMNWQRAAGP